MWRHLDISTYIPVHLTTAASLVNVPRVAHLLKRAMGQTWGKMAEKPFSRKERLLFASSR